MKNKSFRKEKRMVMTVLLAALIIALCSCSHQQTEDVQGVVKKSTRQMAVTFPVSDNQENITVIPSNNYETIDVEISGIRDTVSICAEGISFADTNIINGKYVTSVSDRDVFVTPGYFFTEFGEYYNSDYDIGGRGAYDGVYTFTFSEVLPENDGTRIVSMKFGELSLSIQANAERIIISRNTGIKIDGVVGGFMIQVKPERGNSIKIAYGKTLTIFGSLNTKTDLHLTWLDCFSLDATAPISDFAISDNLYSTPDFYPEQLIYADCVSKSYKITYDETFQIHTDREE